MVTFTFIRHGESTDNLKSVWAGWKDSPLSNHGMNQAKALAETFADIEFTVIHSSDLQRAWMTAEAIQSRQKGHPLLIPSQLLREQHYGIAEGKQWIPNGQPGVTLEENIANGIYPTIYVRDEKFPEGESLNDLSRRTRQALDDILLPYVTQLHDADIHVAIASHGLFIKECLLSLFQLDCEGQSAPFEVLSGLRNTAWSRVIVTAKETSNTQGGTSVPQYIVQPVCFNRHEHLDSLKRQKGGIGSSAFDPKQKDIRAYFGGGLQTND